MDRRWLGLLAIPLVLGLMLVSPFLLGFFAPPSPPNDEATGEPLANFMNDKKSDVLAVRILQFCVHEILCLNLFCGEMIYPDLRGALFIPLPPGEWNTTARFVNDTIETNGEVFYEESFQIPVTDVEIIYNAIYTGLANSFPSHDSVSDAQFINGFGLDILYTDGTWVQLSMIPSRKGHIMFLNGTYTGTPNPVNPFDLNFIHRDENRLNGILLEPGTGLNKLLLVMSGVFMKNLG